MLFRSVGSGVTLKDSAFQNCSNLIAATLIPGGSVTSIGAMAFVSCSNLSWVVIPDGITTIKATAFYATDIKSIVIPDSVTTIEGVAFSAFNRAPLQIVHFGSGLTTIHNWAFYNTSLSSVTFKEVTNQQQSLSYVYLPSLPNEHPFEDTPIKDSGNLPDTATINAERKQGTVTYNTL